MLRVLTISLAALALLVAGCGGGDDDTDKETYERQVNEVGQALDRTFDQLGESISSSGSAQEAAGKLEEGADSLARAAGDFDEIDPPSDIEDAHDKIVAALKALAEDFREGAEAAKQGDVNELLAFAQGLQTSQPVRDISEASQEIEKAGYDFGSGGESQDGSGN